jgi:tetratricopeptide (TPR) repeat protein
LALKEKKKVRTRNKGANRVEQWILKGLKHEDSGEFEEAIDCYKQAINGSESDKEAWNNIGLAYQFLGDIKNADIALNKALEIDPEYAVAWETKGYLYLKANQFNEAIEYLKKALLFGKNKADIWVTLGIIFSTQLKLEDAIEAYENALKIEPNNINALNNNAIANQLLSQLREESESIEMLERAISYFEHALAIDPNKAEIWNNYGVVLGFLGRFKSSLSAIDKAILLAPNYGNAYFNRARIYLQIGSQNKALAQLKIAVDLDPKLYKDAIDDLTLRKLKNTAEFKKMIPL